MMIHLESIAERDSSFLGLLVDWTSQPGQALACPAWGID